MDMLGTLTFYSIIGTNMLLLEITKERWSHACGVYRIHEKLCGPVRDKYPVPERIFVGQCDKNVLRHNDSFDTIYGTFSLFRKK